MSDRGAAQRHPIDLVMVEDSATDAELISDVLKEAGLIVTVRRVDDEAGFRAALDERLPDAILADWSLPNYSGRSALVFARERCPEVPLILVSGSISGVFVSEALRQGAIDFVFKHELQQLGQILIRAVYEARANGFLRESEEKYRRLFEGSRDALMILKPPSWHFSDANQAALEMFGAASKKEFLALEPGDLSPERQPDGCLSSERRQEMIATAMRDGSHLFEWEHRRLNGTTFPTDTLLTLMEGNEQALLVETARDTTERRRSTEELDRHRHHLEELVETRTHELEMARSVAEKASLAKSEFLSSMSHELRSPLNAILGFAQLLESEAPPPTPNQKVSISQILQAGWHLLKLIDEILDLAKVESGRVPISQEIVLLREVMLECQGMTEQQAEKKGIKLSFPEFHIPHFVHADRTRVKQVVLNLLSNAIKYNRPGGTITVGCTVSAPDRTRISIKDTGPGLNPDQMEQLFQPFNRLGQEVNGEEGTGIGLVVAKRLVELMGGEIGVESTVGAGSVFWFDLYTAAEPLLSVEESDTAPWEIPQAARAKGMQTLLYVEDNPANMKLVEQIVARQRHIRLLTAMDGQTGVTIAHECQPDVIVMDINLPGINGYQALNILRSDPVTVNIPVIALSANAMSRDIKKGLDAGFFRYLTKPIKVREFTDTLDAAMALARPASAVNK